MSKKSSAPAHNHPETEECAEGCPLRPHFQDHSSVQLTRDKYVQLLIEARETDPGCWPPGLEDAARLLERACRIEEQCAEKYGQFEPERLNRKVRDEYLNIHLALDDLQNELEDDEKRKADSQHSATDVDQSDLESSASIGTSSGTWTEVTSHPRTENFA